MKEKVCGVTGHREIPAEYMEQAEQGLRREIEKAIADGYTYFISGFADGADQLFAGIVLEKAKDNPALRLEAAIPGPGPCWRHVRRSRLSAKNGLPMST